MAKECLSSPVATDGELELPAIDSLEIDGLVAETHGSEVYGAKSLLADSNHPNSLVVKIAKHSIISIITAQNEAEVAQLVDSSNIMPLLGSGTIRQPNTRWSGLPYMIAPHHSGLTFSDHKVTDGESANSALRIVSEVASGLQDLNSYGFVHGDIKESNIFISKDGRVFISDLGLATPIDRYVTAKYGKLLDGRTLGSIGCMPPEQMCNYALCEKADVFSLGAMAIRSLTGKHPWKLLNEANTGSVSCDDIFMQMHYSDLTRHYPEYVPKDIMGLLYECVSGYTYCRPSIDYLISFLLDFGIGKNAESQAFKAYNIFSSGSTKPYTLTNIE